MIIKRKSIRLKSPVLYENCFDVFGNIKLIEIRNIESI